MEKLEAILDDEAKLKGINEIIKASEKISFLKKDRMRLEVHDEDKLEEIIAFGCSDGVPAATGCAVLYLSNQWI
jgi:hypothetical protein